MTEILNKEFSRKSFVKGGGALVVGFSARGCRARRQGERGAARLGRVPAADATQVDSWLTINADNTAMLQDEPDRDRPGHHDRPADDRRRGARHEREPGAPQRLTTVAARQHGLDTAAAPASSRAAGPPLRAAAATAKQALLEPRRDEPRRPGGEPHRQGRRRLGRRQDRHLRRSCSATSCSTRRSSRRRSTPASAPSKPVSQYKVVGRRACRGSTSRTRSPASTPTCTTSASRACCTHASCGRAGRGRSAPARRSSRSTRARSSTSRARSVVRQGDFLAVVAPKEYDAVQAAAQLKVTWKESRAALELREPLQQMRADDTAGKAPAAFRTNTGNVDTALKSAAKSVSATYSTTTGSRAVIGPSCAVADVRGDSATIYSSTPERCSARHGDRRPARAAGQERALVLLRGRELVRLGRRRASESRQGGGAHVEARRASRCACSSCAGTRTAGTTSRPRRSMDVAGRGRCERQARRVRPHAARSSRTRPDRHHVGADRARRIPTTMTGARIDDPSVGDAYFIAEQAPDRQDARRLQGLPQRRLAARRRRGS